MEQIARPRKALFVFLVAVFWGGGMDLLMWLSHRHDARRVGSVYHIGSVYRIAADLVVELILGLVMGLLIWDSLKRSSHVKATGKKAIVKTVLFWMLMVFLAVLLWRMW